MTPRGRPAKRRAAPAPFREQDDRGEYRPIYVALLDRDEYQQLTPAARLTLYVLKLSLGASGIRLVYPGVIEARTGLDAEDQRAAIEQLRAAGWIETSRPWAAAGLVVWLKNGLRFEPHHDLRSASTRQGIERHLRTLPPCSLVDAFRTRYLTPPGNPSYPQSEAPPMDPVGVPPMDPVVVPPRVQDPGGQESVEQENVEHTDEASVAVRSVSDTLLGFPQFETKASEASPTSPNDAQPSEHSLREFSTTTTGTPTSRKSLRAGISPRQLFPDLDGPDLERRTAETLLADIRADWNGRLPPDLTRLMLTTSRAELYALAVDWHLDNAWALDPPQRLRRLIAALHPDPDAHRLLPPAEEP